jgi:hypothetical protein
MGLSRGKDAAHCCSSWQRDEDGDKKSSSCSESCLSTRARSTRSVEKHSLALVCDVYDSLVRGFLLQETLESA